MSGGIHIVRVEVENFKSYRGKHTIGPFSNFSCVIGPNGAGKSNITDAVGFAFGVSPASMRITSFRDLITSGTTSSTVCVVLSIEGVDNTIVRTIKSNDTTTVKLNDRTVGEKELDVFLTRCNISVKMKNFLVFQHEVEAIAQKKSRELTEMMELVSGSIEYKERYNAARKVVDDSSKRTLAMVSEKRETNAEVNRFRIQKKEADKFQEFGDRLTTEKMELALMQLYHLECELQEKKNALSGAKREVLSLESKSSTETEAVKDKKKHYAELHKQHLLALKTVRDKANDVREKKVLLERLRVNVNHLELRKVKETQDLTRTSAQGQTRSTEIARLETDLKHQEAELKKFEEQCAAQDAADGKINFSGSTLDEYKRLRKEADCESITMRQELETMRRNRDAQREAVRRAQVSQEEMLSRVKEVEESLGLCDERLQQLVIREKEAAEELKDAEAQYESLNVGMQHILQSRAQKQEELSRIQSQLDQLRFTKEENRQTQVFNEAITAMTAMTRGIRGKLLDLCTISNSKYTVAVTVALGKNLEAVVVDTQSAALECVRYLKENRVGIMDFIPLDVAKGKGADDRHRSFGGTCRPVVDVLKFDPSLEPAIRYALGQTLVCDTLEEARRVAFHSGDGQRYKVVTIDGSMLLKNGAIQGGLQTVKERAKKWDERTYDSLKATRQKLQGELFDNPEAAETKAVSDAKAAQQRVEAAQRAKQRVADEMAATKEKQKALTLEKKKLNESVHKSKDVTEKQEAALQELEREMQGVQAKVKTIESKIFADFQKKVGIKDISDWQDRESHKASTRAEKRQQFMILMARLRNQLEAEIKRVGVRSAGDLEVALHKTEDDLKKAHKELKAQEGLIAQFEKQADAATKELQKIKTQLEETEAEIRKSSKKGAEEGEAMARARKSVAVAAIACEKIRAERKAVYVRCMLSDVVIPHVRGEEAKKRAKEGNPDTRKAKRRGGGADHEDEEESAAIIDEPSHDLQTSEAFAVEETGGNNPTGGRAAQGTTVAIDFGKLPERLRRAAMKPKTYQELKYELESSIKALEETMDRLAPNLKAGTKYATSEKKLDELTKHLDDVRDVTRTSMQDWNKVRELRFAKFMRAFDTINESVGRVYKDLTEGTRAAGVHGSAYLTLDNADEPYNGGTKYHATPPMKRFMGMEALSGGERTMAALALLFAIHSVHPAPFVILDEVDAALDTANVLKLAHYLRTNSGACQFVVVSLKEELYHRADCLLGVYKDKDRDSSGVLSVDLTSYVE